MMSKRGDHEYRSKSPRRERTNIRGALAGFHAPHVGAERNPDRRERNNQERGSTNRSKGRAHIEDGGSGKPNDDAQPIEPEAKKSVKRTEVMPGPDVHAARFRMPDGKRRNGNRQRNGKAERA